MYESYTNEKSQDVNSECGSGSLVKISLTPRYKSRECSTASIHSESKSLNADAEAQQHISQLSTRKDFDEGKIIAECYTFFLDGKSDGTFTDLQIND